MQRDQIEPLLSLLRKLLDTSVNRTEVAYQVEDELQVVGKSLTTEAELRRILSSLQDDLAYYEEDEEGRNEHPSLFGNEELDEIVKTALRQIETSGEVSN